MGRWRLRRGMAALVVALIAVSFLAACGGSGDGSGAAAPEPADGGPSEVTEAAAPVDDAATPAQPTGDAATPARPTGDAPPPAVEADEEEEEAAEAEPPVLNALGVEGAVVYTRRNDLFYSAGSEERVLFQGEGGVIAQSPSLSPDGERVVYVTWDGIPREERPRGSDLRVIALAGGEVVLREHTREGEFFWTPRWGPAGRRVIYAHQLAEADEGRAFTLGIEWVDVDSGQVTLIRERASEPAYAPDGETIVYVDDPALDPSLAVLDASGEARVIAGAADGLLLPRRPVFSPDGAWIAFLASGEGPSVAAPVLARAANGFQDIWLIRPDGSDLRRLTEFRLDAPDIAWSADGASILLYGPAEAIVVDVETGAYVIVGEGFTHAGMDWRSDVRPATGR